jgi:hypothetical protein
MSETKCSRHAVTHRARHSDERPARVERLFSDSVHSGQPVGTERQREPYITRASRRRVPTGRIRSGYGSTSKRDTGPATVPRFVSLSSVYARRGHHHRVRSLCRRMACVNRSSGRCWDTYRRRRTPTYPGGRERYPQTTTGALDASGALSRLLGARFILDECSVRDRCKKILSPTTVIATPTPHATRIVAGPRRVRSLLDREDPSRRPPSDAGDGVSKGIQPTHCYASSTGHRRRVKRFIPAADVHRMAPRRGHSERESSLIGGQYRGAPRFYRNRGDTEIGACDTETSRVETPNGSTDDG